MQQSVYLGVFERSADWQRHAMLQDVLAQHGFQHIVDHLSSLPPQIADKFADVAEVMHFIQLISRSFISINQTPALSYGVTIMSCFRGCQIKDAILGPLDLPS